MFNSDDVNWFDRQTLRDSLLYLRIDFAIAHLYLTWGEAPESYIAF